MPQMALIKTTCLTLSTLLTLAISGVNLHAQDDRKPDDRDRKENRDRDGSRDRDENHDRDDSRDPMKNLTADERTKLREAMRDVWADPAVVQSRQDVDQSVKAFKAAIGNALVKNDPSLKEILDKMERDNPGGKAPIKPMFDGKGRRPSGAGSNVGGSDMRGFERMTESPSILEKLSDEQKKHYFEVREKVQGSPEIKAIMKKFEVYRKQDDELRGERTKLFGELRKTFHKKMIEADPAMEEILKNAGPPKQSPRSKPEGKDDGKS